MLSLRKELTLQTLMLTMYILTKNQMTTTKQTHTHTVPCQSRESNPGPFATHSGALNLGHRVN